MPNIDLQETQEELQWLEKKLDIKANRVIRARKRPVRRGEVYGCDFGYNVGSEMRGYHPCVIIQSDSTTATFATVCVAPITHATTRAHTSATLVPITQQTDPKTGAILIEGYADVANIRTVSKARLTTFKAKLPASDMQKIDSELSTVVGLYPYYQDVSDKLARAQRHAALRDGKVKKLRELLKEIDLLIPEDASEELKAKIAEAFKV